MTAVGGGKMDMPGIVEVSAATTDWYIVELDRCATDMRQACADSYTYLTTQGLARGQEIAGRRQPHESQAGYSA